MGKGLAEIVITNQDSLKIVISDALELQAKEEAKKDYSKAIGELRNSGIRMEDGISREIVYSIAKALGVSKENAEQALRPLDLKRDVLKLSKKLRLKNSFGSFECQRYMVNRELARILINERKFRFYKIYSPQEIESIFNKKGIRLNISQLISEGLQIDSIGDGQKCEGYYFLSMIDSEGNEKYRLYKHNPGM